jgi:hypothetical protein
MTDPLSSLEPITTLSMALRSGILQSCDALVGGITDINYLSELTNTP